MKYPPPQVGKVYGSWTVLTVGPKCLCECACKNRVLVGKSSLVNGSSTKCRSCKSRIIGLANRKFHYPAGCTKKIIKIVRSSIQRCTNRNHTRWDDWGGRGIRVWKDWIEDQVKYAEHLISLPGWDNPLLEIDRVNNDKGYFPGNLRFVTRAESLANRRKYKPRKVR